MKGEEMKFQPDRGYSWVILFAAFMLNVQYSCGVGSAGVFLVEFIDYFQVSKASAAVLAGLLLCTGFILGIPVGWLCRHYGYRVVAISAAILSPLSLLASAIAPNITTLYFTYGCLTSTALATLHNAGNIAVQRYFKEKRALASGIAVCGVSVGVFLWAPFSRWTIDLYGWRGALVIGAGVQFHSLVFALLLRPAPPSQSAGNSVTERAYEEEGNGDNLYSREQDIYRGKSSIVVDKKDDPADSSYEQRQRVQGSQTVGRGCCGDKRSPFTLFIDYPSIGLHLIGLILVQAGHIIPYSLIPVRAKALGIGKSLAATLVSMLGISSLCARVLVGFVGDVRCVNRAVLSGVSGVGAGVCTFISAFLNSYPLLATYTSLLGTVSAPYIALQAAAVVDIVGVENAETGVGFLASSIGFAHILALSLSGLILDRLRDPFLYAFMVFGVGQVLGGTVIVLTACWNTWRSHRRRGI